MHCLHQTWWRPIFRRLNWFLYWFLKCFWAILFWATDWIQMKRISDDLWVVSLHQAVNYPSLTSSVNNNTICFFENESVDWKWLVGFWFWCWTIWRDELIKSSKHPCVAVVAIQIMVGVYTTLLLRWYYWVIWSNGIDISCISCV